MLKFKLLLLLFLFFFNKAFSSEIYLKCEEKISEIITDSHSKFRLGKIIGTSFVQINTDLKNPKITIYFKEKQINEDQNFYNIVYDQEGITSSLGIDINKTILKNNGELELSYSFMEFDNIYGLTKKAFYWEMNSSVSNPEKYEYSTVSRCKKIDEKTYNNIPELLNTTLNIDYKWNGKMVTREIFCKNARKANMPKYYPKKYKIKCENNFANTKKENINLKNEETIQGTRSIALSWDGYDELIIGNIKFNEKDSIGKIEFDLSKNNSCFGTYVLSEKKGTWSVLCEENEMNASGFLKWDKRTGIVSGNGKDENNNKIKFKIIE